MMHRCWTGPWCCSEVVLGTRVLIPIASYLCCWLVVAFEHGEHKAYPANGGPQTPACNLYLSMLQRFGVESDRFGTSTGTLEGLS